MSLNTTNANKSILIWLLLLSWFDLCWVATQGLYSLSGRTSYRKISWNLEAVRLGVIMIVLLCNLTGISAAKLPMCLSNFRAIEKVEARTSSLRDFARICSTTSARLVNRCPGLPLKQNPCQHVNSQQRPPINHPVVKCFKCPVCDINRPYCPCMLQCMTMHWVKWSWF